MTDNPVAARRIQRNRLIKSLIVNLAVIGLTVYLFMPAGPVYTGGRVDLTFLILPVVIYCLVRFAAAFCLIYIASRSGYALSCLLRGAALAFLLFWIFDRAILLTRLSFLSGLQKFLSGLTAIEYYSLLFIFGLTLAAICGLYNVRTKEKYLGPLGIFLGQFIMGFSLCQAVGFYSQYWQAFEGIGIMIMAGMSALALSTLGILGEHSGNAFVSDFCSWLRSSPVGKFFIGVALAFYLIFVRSVLFDHVSYAFLIEWILICVVVWRIYRDIHNILRSRYTVVPVELDWQKHVQKIDYLYDEDFNKIGLLQMDFVELGSRRGLLNYLRQVLLSNNLKDDQINLILGNLIEYSDKKIPWYSIWIWRKRTTKKNLENRKLTLQNTISNLAELAHPAYQRNRSKI